MASLYVEPRKIHIWYLELPCEDGKDGVSTVACAGQPQFDDVVLDAGFCFIHTCRNGAGFTIFDVDVVGRMIFRQWSTTGEELGEPRLLEPYRGVHPDIVCSESQAYFVYRLRNNRKCLKCFFLDRESWRDVAVISDDGMVRFHCLESQLQLVTDLIGW